MASHPPPFFRLQKPPVSATMWPMMRRDSGWRFRWSLLWGLILVLVLPIWGLEKGHPPHLSTALAEAQAQGPPEAGGNTNVPPFDLTDGAAIKEGAALFATRCTGYCHARGGGPGRAPKLRGRTFDKDYLFQAIANGIVVMPAWKGILSDEQIWAIVAYILSLSHVEE